MDQIPADEHVFHEDDAFREDGFREAGSPGQWPGSARGRPAFDPFEDIDAAPPFTIGNAMGLGWRGFASRYGLLLGASALYLVIYVASEIILGITSLFTLLPLGSWAASVLFYPVLGIGLLQIGLHAVRGRPAGIGDLFAGFRRYWPIVGASVLVNLILWGIMLVPMVLIAFGVGMVFALSGSGGGSGGGPGGGPGQAVVIGLVVCGMLAVLVPVLLIYPRVVFAPLVCLDTEIRTTGVTESIRLSWRMTAARGVRGRLVGVGFLIFLIGVVCAVLLIVPVLLFAMPFGIAVYAAAYWQVSRGYWSMQHNACRRCMYDLRSSRGGVCPECGTPVPDAQQQRLGIDSGDAADADDRFGYED